jgi:lysophospholipase L1-like esterase
MNRMRSISLAALVAAATLSGCAAQEPPAPVVSTPKAVPTPASYDTVAVVGDSISVGYNACSGGGPCKDASWATGSMPQVHSVAARLGISTSSDVHNLAISGSRIRNTPQEMSRITAPVDLVLVLAGANDICQPSVASMTEPETFAWRLRQLLDEIDRQSPDAAVLVMSVPDVTQVATIDGVPARVQTQRINATLCGSVLGTSRHEVTADDIAMVKQRIKDYDAAIIDECAERERCVDDGGALTAHRFVLDQLSRVDYFHPSLEGQRAISQMAWDTLQRTRP